MAIVETANTRDVRGSCRAGLLSHTALMARAICLAALPASVSLLGASFAGHAFAATAAAASDTSVEEVIVTARKRDESVAKVPISITAFTSQTLETKNIQSFDDYATKVPDLSFSYGGGPTGISDARTVAIRGITGQNLTGTAGATRFYIDDTRFPVRSTHGSWISTTSECSRARKAPCMAKARWAAMCGW